MKFLKEIIARKLNPPDDGFYASIALSEDDQAERQLPANEEQIVDNNSAYQDASEKCEISRPHTFGEPGSIAGAATDVPCGSDRSVASSTTSQPWNGEALDGEIVKILEMFAEGDPVAEIPDTAKTPNPSDVELAREAMNSFASSKHGQTKPAQSESRVRTRILGFQGEEPTEQNTMSRKVSKPMKAFDQFPIGWLVLIDGPGRGASFTLQHGVSKIGRGDEQKIKLDFGDNSISREDHATIAYDENLNACFIGHCGKSNLVRLNGRPVLSTEELSDGDLIGIGETTLYFVALCNAEFAWDLTDDQEVDLV